MTRMYLFPEQLRGPTISIAIRLNGSSAAVVVPAARSPSGPLPHEYILVVRSVSRVICPSGKTRDPAVFDSPLAVFRTASRVESTACSSVVHLLIYPAGVRLHLLMPFLVYTSVCHSFSQTGRVVVSPVPLKKENCGN